MKKGDKKIPSNKPNELLACFDHDENEIKSMSRQEVHSTPLTVWHGVASVWLLNNRGEILCSKRSPYVEGNPNKWQTYFGGHIKAGSKFLSTLKREVKEEIGLDVKEDQIVLIDSGKREDVMHVYKNYAILFDGDLSTLTFVDGEVSEAKWLSFDEYQKQKEAHPDQWCNSMKLDQHQRAKSALNIAV